MKEIIMRDIKFRVWDKQRKRFSRNNIMGMDGVICCSHLEHYILMQYTGLLDTNGVEVYEGDIVSGYIFGICEVRYYKNAFVLWSVDEDFSRSYACESIEVIGNICENPELIKEKLWD